MRQQARPCRNWTAGQQAGRLPIRQRPALGIEDIPLTLRYSPHFVNPRRSPRNRPYPVSQRAGRSAADKSVFS
jgi:hypothetical protein